MSCEPELEAALVASWDSMVEFYADWVSSRWAGPLLELIGELRDAGYDRQLRAGQSMTTFVVSRSRVHGMQQDQASVALSPRDEHVIVIPSWRQYRKRDALAIGYECDPRLIEILDELVAYPIS